MAEHVDSQVNMPETFQSPNSQREGPVKVPSTPRPGCKGACMAESGTWRHAPPKRRFTRGDLGIDVLISILKDYSLSSARRTRSA